MDLSWLWWYRPLIRHQETGRQISMHLRPAWSTYIAPSQPTTLSEGWGVLNLQIYSHYIY